jgi:dTDP-glucose pyrophosphorylase
MINIVIPMAGLGSRFANAGYKNPKPFIDVLGRPMIERVMENVNLANSRFILIGRKEHFILENSLIEQIKSRYPNTECIGIDKLTEGTACTLLYAKKFIDNDDTLLIANSDQIVDINLNLFVEDCFTRNLDGSILTFKDFSKNPKWSFAKTDDNGLVIEVKEKVAISDDATVGIYLYKCGKDFVDATIQMIIENDRVNNEFYTCPTYNYAICNGKKIGIFEIPEKAMHGIGTPEDLNFYIDFKRKN